MQHNKNTHKTNGGNGLKYIESTIEDIYINLALEEYIYQNLKNDDYFMLFINQAGSY